MCIYIVSVMFNTHVYISIYVSIFMCIDIVVLTWIYINYYRVCNNVAEAGYAAARARVRTAARLVND